MLLTCQKPETGHVRQMFRQTAIENVVEHLTELVETLSMSIIASQEQNL
jgi:hypothetical protein